MRSNTGSSSRFCWLNTLQVRSHQYGCMPIIAHCTREIEEVMQCIGTGQGVLQKVVVDGLEIVITEGPPLKKFVTPPKLSADLAK